MQINMSLHRFECSVVIYSSTYNNDQVLIFLSSFSHSTCFTPSKELEKVSSEWSLLPKKTSFFSLLFKLYHSDLPKQQQMQSQKKLGYIDHLLELCMAL